MLGNSQNSFQELCLKSHPLWYLNPVFKQSLKISKISQFSLILLGSKLSLVPHWVGLPCGISNTD